MVKKIFSLMLAMLFFAPVTAFAASSGFYGVGGYTETTNGYLLDYKNAVLVDPNKEVIHNYSYDEFHAGSTFYVPLLVYEGTALSGKASDPDFVPVPATAQMVKADDVTISSKIQKGSKYIGDIELLDPKKLKINGLDSGMYVRIPLTSDYQDYEKSDIKLDIVLSVNGVSYQETRTTLECFITNRVERIYKDTVYGAKSATQYEVTRTYSGNVTFDFGENVIFTTKVKSLDKYYLNLSREPNEEIAGMYTEKGTFLGFYNFIGDEDTFYSVGNLEIPVKRENLVKKKGGDESLYVYRIDGDNLTALGADTVSFNSKTNKLTIKTNTLDNYVISNQALMNYVEQKDDENILKTGYAAIEPDEAPEELGASASSPASRAASSAASGGAAPAAPSSAARNIPEGDVPEEDVPEEVIQGIDWGSGPPINAGNTSADNPSTADSPMLPVAFAGIAVGALGLIFSRKSSCSI